MKQKEKKRIASKLFAALVVLTLISCCFVGTTFARYTSTNVGGNATIDVAKWDIDVASGSTVMVGETTANITQLSPSKDTTDNATNTSTPVLVAVVTNKSEVSATIDYIGNVYEDFYAADSTFSGDLPGFLDENEDLLYDERTEEYGYMVTVDSSYEGGKYYYYDVDGTNSDKAGKEILSTDYHDSGETENIMECFSLTFYISSTAPTDSIPTTTEMTAFNSASEAVRTLDSGETKYVYATITWETQDDDMDTWIGTCVQKIEWNIYLTAVQASQIPASN